MKKRSKNHIRFGPPYSLSFERSFSYTVIKHPVTRFKTNNARLCRQHFNLHNYSYNEVSGILFNQ